MHGVFAQGLELARHLDRRLGVPVNHRCLWRVRHTEPQMELPAKGRRRDIRGAFAVAHGFSASRVVILGNVTTTGAIVDELARVLKRAAVERADAWSVARAA
jgi:predicted amidophosphoribosyltransferase